MAASGLKWRALRQIWKLLIGFVVLASAFVIANPGLRVGASAALAVPFMEQEESSYGKNEGADYGHVRRILNGLWHKGQGQGQVVYKHVWPEMEFGWRIVVGTIVGFLGAAFGSVGGVGGGGIFVPMLTLIIGFDAKSSIAISKCIITGAAAATVYYNLKERHPTLELPIIDYDLALLFQPMLVLGISVGVALNVILSEWMITILLIIIFLFTSTKSFLKGVETWKKETISKKEAARRMASQGDGTEEVTYKPPGETNGVQAETKESKKSKVSMLQNVYWKELGLLFTVWTIVLALQIAKNYSRTCSAEYWVLNILQIPVAAGVTAYEAVSLYKGRRKIASKGDSGINWKVHKLVLYSACGMLAGIIGGLLGLGGGFILGPLFLEMGIPPQVSSATSTFAMTFSASMSAIEYYLLKRFPVPYALYFFAVGTIAALVGQHVVGKLIRLSGRASVIIFILSLTIFVSAITLGGVGLSDMIKRFERKEYMGFDTLC